MITSGTNYYIEELIYVPMGSSVPVYNRPYTVNATHDAIQGIHDRMMESNRTKVTPNILGQYTEQLIQPNAVAMPTDVNMNWCTDKRYIFMLKVIDKMPVAGLDSVIYIQGFTDHQGISANGNADGRMVHRINNIIETVKSSVMTPFGVEVREKLTSIYNVLSATSVGYFTQRPTDVLESIDTHNTATFLSDSGLSVEGFNGTGIIDLYNSRVNGSVVSNNIKSNYLSRVINGGVTDNLKKSIHLDSNDFGISSDSNSEINEPSIRDNMFLSYLFHMAGYNKGQNRSTFTFNELANLDHTIFDRFKLYNLTKSHMDPNMLNTPEVGEYWTGQDPVTLKAYSLIESAVAMATKFGFNKLTFTVTNMEVQSIGPKIYITDFKSFLSLGEHDFKVLLDSFINDFISEVIMGETMSGRLPIYADVYVDILGTTKINLGYAGYPQTWYTIPTTANTLFSPVMTYDKNSLDKTIEQFNNLISHISYGMGNGFTNF